MVNNDEVQEVVLKSGTLTVTPKDQKSEGITYQVTMMGDEQELVDLFSRRKALRTTKIRRILPERSFYIADRHSAGCDACRCHGMGDAQHE